MCRKAINLNINGIDFDAVVYYTPATNVPAKLFGLPENCHPDESEDIEIVSMYMHDTTCGIKIEHDVSFLIDGLQDDILEQLSDD